MKILSGESCRCVNVLGVVSLCMVWMVLWFDGMLMRLVYEMMGLGEMVVNEDGW